MRDFKSMKRQRGRNRSGGPGGGGGGKSQQNANRAFESNGPDNLKIRGHAQHVYEKYQQLARDAMSAGDRVLGENFLQHAEHYFRLIRTLQPNRPYTDIVSREGFASGYDIDFEDEGANDGGDDQEVSADGAEGQSGEDRGGEYRDQQQPRQDRWESRNGDGRSDQPRQDYNRQDRGGYGANRNGAGNGNGGGANNGGRDRNFNRDRNEGRWENRNSDGQNDRNANDRNQGDRNQGDRNDGARFDNNRDNRAESQNGDARGDDRRPERQDRDRAEQSRSEPRADQARTDQNRSERDGYGRRDRVYGERTDRNRDPLAVVEPQAAPLTVQAPEPAPQETATAPAAKTARTRVLRSRDGDESHTPAFLQAASAPSAAAAAEDAPVKRPRGRPRKTADTASETEDV